jgi:hypothetical protein
MVLVFTTDFVNYSYFCEDCSGTCLKRKIIKDKGKAVSTVTGLKWPRGFQEVKVPGFHDNGTGWW